MEEKCLEELSVEEVSYGLRHDGVNQRNLIAHQKVKDLQDPKKKTTQVSRLLNIRTIYVRRKFVTLVTNYNLHLYARVC